MSNNFFNINRLCYLLRRQIILNSNSILIAYSATAGVLFIIFFLMGIGSRSCNYTEQVSVFFPVFYIGGYILTSKIFSELSDYRSGYIYLTLPTSNFEKLLVGWLYSSILFIIIGAISVVLITMLANSIAALVMGFQFIPFNYSFNGLLLNFGVYMVTQSIFVLGAATFKKHPFLKTLLALFIITICLSIISGLLGWGIIANFKIYYFEAHKEDFSPELTDFMETTVPQIFKIIYWYIMAPFLLVVSYFKLKESEV